MLELKSWINKLIIKGNNKLLVQEIIQGPDSNALYFTSYHNKKHQCLGYFCGRKIRIYPIHFGVATYFKTEPSDPIKHQCLRLLQENKYVGVAGIEMKLDERDGIYKLIEVNTRFSLIDVIGKRLGVNIYYITYLDIIDKSQRPKLPNFKKSYSWIALLGEMKVIPKYYKEGLTTIREWVSSLLGNVYFADIYLDEPRILMHIILNIFNKIFTFNSE